MPNVYSTLSCHIWPHIEYTPRLDWAQLNDWINNTLVNFGHSQGSRPEAFIVGITIKMNTRPVTVNGSENDNTLPVHLGSYTVAQPRTQSQIFGRDWDSAISNLRSVFKNVPAGDNVRQLATPIQDAPRRRSPVLVFLYDRDTRFDPGTQEQDAFVFITYTLHYASVSDSSGICYAIIKSIQKALPASRLLM
ncbi:hypothetical protein NP233_g4410 [Leucocoprinus birnbaumii]|uniref:Uncharacterized protein n=1 Tax=Leucocoprinus birnbaumii TaxID=56174 RepID=A0AAD5VUR0_9AGAR|nr:hypothetical protein NP233_g4410 [Leucocoprinus birnbaumii]